METILLNILLNEIDEMKIVEHVTIKGGMISILLYRLPILANG